MVRAVDFGEPVDPGDAPARKPAAGASGCEGSPAPLRDRMSRSFCPPVNSEPRM